LESQKKISDELAAQYKSQSEEYMEVKKKLTHMGLEPDGDYNTFQATVQITELNNELSEILQNRLAPLKYQPYMFAVKNNELLKKNFFTGQHNSRPIEIILFIQYHVPKFLSRNFQGRCLLFNYQGSLLLLSCDSYIRLSHLSSSVNNFFSTFFIFLYCPFCNSIVCVTA